MCFQESEGGAALDTALQPEVNSSGHKDVPAQANFPSAPPLDPRGPGLQRARGPGSPPGPRGCQPGDYAPAHRRGGRQRGCHSRRWSPPSAVPGGSGSSLSRCLSPTMVLESVVADLLNRFLGDYVENLNKSQLKLGIWGGPCRGVAPSRILPGPCSLRRRRLPLLRLRSADSRGPNGAGSRLCCRNCHL
ncbi:hypothetical protein P7K49_016992 [Saguinus oedipus]|uniref:Chorein N-terminal domain-containing protein n=1 Tax=Saguinus oedipus TaxID=9490 RepID=A0ABQ9V1A0_SAGOE|nr:hypothetical protein P7K49_016992 [Saguinus oedipus]